MDFDEAIRAHSSWKLKLSNYLRTPDKSIDIATLEVDNKCPLGCWVHGEGTKYASSPEFVTLKAEHAKFHKAAAAVARKAESGKAVSEETALGGKSDFSQASQAVISAIMAIKKRVGT